MPETLVIRLSEDADVDAQWTVIDDAGTRIGDVRRGALSAAAAEQLQRQVVVLVPGTQTVTARTTLPVRSASKMLQVVPFALEPQIAGDIGDMHFAVGSRSADGDVNVVAVARRTMSTWMDALSEAGISARRVLPDTAGVPVTDDGMTVVILQDEAYLRNSHGDVFMVDHDSVVPTLELLTQPAESVDHDEIVAIPDDEDTEAEERIAVSVYLDDSCGASGEALLSGIQAAFPATEYRRLPNGLLPRIGAEACQSDTPNLLQGDYARGADLRKYWLPWRTAAGLVAGLVLVSLAAKGAELFTYKSRFATLNAQIQQTYTETFPGETLPSNPRLDFERRMQPDGASAAGSDFLEGLKVFSASRGESSDAVVTTLNYNAGVIGMEILAADVRTLDAMRERVSQTLPWQAKLTQTSPEDDKIKGRLQIERATQ